MRTYERAHPKPQVKDRIIGIDGEGKGRRPHNYFFIAAADESGRTWSTESDVRITTIQALDFILSLPVRSLKVMYAGMYDWTKILQDMPNEALFVLFRERLRQYRDGDKVKYRPVKWNGYKLNFINRRMTIEKDGRRATVWDVFRFFQGKFIKALIDWKVAEEKLLERMQFMKDARSRFDTMSREEINAYCEEECRYLATLTRQLLNAHDGAGIELEHYYGAGSTASALLKKWGIKDKRGSVPDDMRQPVASAFFGGRFENSVVGPIRTVVNDFDINSAYPYAASLLPCLQHGSWQRVTRYLESAIDSAQLALVRWSAPNRGRDTYSNPWGPLPVRASDGTIAFPLAARGGWTWKQEWLAARRINHALSATEAWVYKTDCVCQPFSGLPAVYLERLKLGKDNLKGIPLKLGPNSVYGKLAQSRGANPPFQSWVWAGNITSRTRAQLLEAILAAKDPANILMLATDGVWTTEDLKLPYPQDTGTGHTGKPLGGWSKDTFEKGLFAVRPGIYFPLEPTEKQLEKVRARGLGKRILYEQSAKIVEAWQAGEESVEVANIERFVGAVSAISWSVKHGCALRSEDYGEWVKHKVSVTFDPRPKRCAINATGTLEPWTYLDFESMPYRAATRSPEAALMQIAELQAEEQPDLDFGDIQ